MPPWFKRRAGTSNLIPSLTIGFSLTAIAVVIDKPAFVARYKEPVSPYDYALEAGLERVCVWRSSTGRHDTKLALKNPKWDNLHMERHISVLDIQDVLNGFVQAGFVCAHSVPEQSNWQSEFGVRQRRLIKTVIEEFCSCFVPGGTIVYIGDAEDKFLHLDVDYLQRLGVIIPAPAKMPDVVVHDRKRNWLLLIEAVTGAGPVDGKRRKELKELFAGCKAGLVFVTAFSTRDAMRSFLTQISWETEVWVAEDPEHLIHFNGERFLGPYPDVMPKVD